MSELTFREDACRLQVMGGRWLSTGVNGGFVRSDRAVNLTVPSDFDRTDLADYSAERCHDVGFESGGPALLTAVEQRNARCARAGPVTVVATAGLSNPATLPVPGDSPQKQPSGDSPPPLGTVNLLVASARSFSDATLASCLATAVEAKAATLVALTGFSGTTSDAIAVGCDPNADNITFVGSSTHVGKCIRACVRDSMLESLEAVHDEIPKSASEEVDGTVTDINTAVSEPYGATGGPPNNEG